MSAIRQFLRRIRSVGVKRPKSVTTAAMGHEREFNAYDIGDDTFVFEKGLSFSPNERASVLIAEKRDLKARARGMLMTVTTGNHSVAAFPLLDGRFWRLSTLPSSRRGDALVHKIVCANIVGYTLEISQREVSTKKLVVVDEWLRQKAGFSLPDIVMAERNDDTLEYYRKLGQEWRVKPLAWTQNEMKVALAASKKRISSKLSYYHSAKGVHFLSFSEFRRFTQLARTDMDGFIKGLKELVSVYEGNRCSFTRMPKHRGHHEIEFFGLRRGVALERVIPEIENLMEDVELGRVGSLGIMQRADEIANMFGFLLTRPELADENSNVFAETLYMYITGEIYAVMGEGSTPAFDDRRTALPGATFTDGHADLHPGADMRTEILLANIRSMMSKDEVVEYANVYELRGEDSGEKLGMGKTREIVYKTSRGPLEHSLIEKRLSRAANGYGSYMLARVEAFKALGVALSDYRLLRRRGGKGRRAMEYYIRKRCEGEPMDAIPANYYCSADDSSVEERETVLAMAALMGDAAAQNMAMKKYDPATSSPLYGVGKEIYEFEYDIVAQRVTPKRVSTCSMRGSFGWPDLSFEDENLRAIAAVYMTHYAHALKDFQKHHGVSMADLAERFMSGFEFRTHAMAWQLAVMRDKFEAFDPPLPKVYDFAKKWRFVMWSLERQERRLPILRKIFFSKVAVVESGGGF